jgi:HSP20 family protein
MTAQELAERKQSEVKRREPDQKTYFRPATDIRETADAVVMKFDMPGVASGDVDLTVEKGVLTVTGKARTEEEGTPVYRETRVGDYQRQFTLNENIDVDHITAEMTAGVLTVRIPKPEKAKPKKIAITAG